MMDWRRHGAGLAVVAAAIAVVAWHGLRAQHAAATAPTGDFLPYYGPPPGESQPAVVDNPRALQVLPSVPAAHTSRDDWKARARMYEVDAPVLGMM